MIINLLAAWIPALLIALSGVMKLSRQPRIVDGMSKLGVGRYLVLLGVMEIAFAALFVVPATMKLGFILASCYFAGAIATELSHDALKVNPSSDRAALDWRFHSRSLDFFLMGGHPGFCS